MRSLPLVVASMVVIFLPAAAEMGVTHERMAFPSRCTVQAPHRAAPQPNLVPVIPSVSRSAQRMGVPGSASSVWFRPLMLSVLMVSQVSVVLGGSGSEAAVGRLRKSFEGVHRFQSGLHRRRNH